MTTNLTETAQWEEGIRQFETSDPVEGGPDGVDNIPTRQLANRTSWLRRVLQFGRTTWIADTGTKNNIVANLVPAVTELLDGMEACFRVAIANDGACTFTPNSAAGSTIPKLPLYAADHADLGKGDLPGGANVRARLDTTLNKAGGGAWVIQSISGGMARIVTPPVGDASTRAANMAAVFAATDGRQVIDMSGDPATITLTASQYGVAMLTLTGELKASKDLVFPAQSGQWIIENSTTGNYNVTAKVDGGSGVVIAAGAPVIVCSDAAAMKLASAGGQAGFRALPLTGIVGNTINIVGGYTPGAVLLERNGALQQPGTAASPDFIATDGLTIKLTTAATADEQFNAYVFATFSVADAVKKSGDAMGGPLALYAGSTVSNPAAGDNSQNVINSAWFKSEAAAETNAGTARVATQAQTTAGTDDATIVTPKKLRAGFSLSLTANGYIAFPSWLGGLIIQWGAAPCAASATTTTTFPLTFPNGCLSITICGYQAAGNQQAYAVVNGKTAANFSWNAFLGAGGSTPVMATTVGAVQGWYVAFGN
ncbi:hypothetical protein WCQ02_20050 [Paraburkholderia tropica]|uniref:gp53-like domain-containing protein n=1 Tax=Paraburkholderia tropica TaxID=92647 RepID=UPI00301A805A